MRIILAAGREQAIARLQELMTAGRNLVSAAAGVPTLQLRNSFLKWVAEVERFVRSAFDSVEPPIVFDSPRLVALQGDRIAADQMYPMLEGETARLTGLLEGAVEALTSPFPAPAAGKNRVLVVMDTNTPAALPQPRPNRLAGARRAGGRPAGRPARGSRRAGRQAQCEGHRSRAPRS